MSYVEEMSTEIKPTWEQIEKIIVEAWQYEEKIDKLEEVIWLLAPSSYEPIIDFYYPYHTLEVLFPKIADWVSYWRYECDSWPMEARRPDGTKIKVHRDNIYTLKQVLLKDELIVE